MRILFTTCFIWIIFSSRKVKGGGCNNELGMRKPQVIPDENITASSSFNSDHSPALARLDGKGAWCSALTDTSPYIQIWLGTKKSITVVRTQGSLQDMMWATKYQIKYLKEGKWFSYQKADGTLTFQGNENVQGLKELDLQPPIQTRSIRIYPMIPQGVTRDATLQNVSCLRLELIGCAAPVNGGWGEWGHWSECSVTCGPGMRSRERKCDSPKPANDGAPCNKTEKVEEERCKKQNCPVNGGWGEWGHWSECSVTCGSGMWSRERKCDSPKPKYNGAPCNETEKREVERCKKQSCKVNGGWGEWGRWSECSATCGPGMRSRERKCDSPKPANDGAPCNKTEKVEVERCKKQNCPAIDGDWGEWGQWSDCSLTCGLGMRSRDRKCDSPKPQNGGMPCREDERVQMRYCRNRKCGDSEGESYGGYSGSGHGWDTFADDGRDGNKDGDSSGSSEDGWYTYNKNTIWSDNDDEDF